MTDLLKKLGVVAIVIGTIAVVGIVTVLFKKEVN